MRRLRILTWHVHGSYLYYLTQADCDFYLPVNTGRTPGYSGRSGPFPWGDNVHEVPAEAVRDGKYDVVVSQSKANWLEDRPRILSARQRRLPRVHIEHDPPREVPTDTRHYVDDPEALLVHVTPFNALMWDSGRTPARVIDHGVAVPAGIMYTGEIPRGIVVINNLRQRGRRLGADVFERLRQAVPLDLVGMDSEALGGLGEIPHDELPAFIARYRFFLNPIRYTSLGLSVLEAMHLGLPILGLATTEMVTAVTNGFNGFVETDVGRLAVHMRRLVEDPLEARRLGEGAQTRARERFGIARFTRDWERTLAEVAHGSTEPSWQGVPQRARSR